MAVILACITFLLYLDNLYTYKYVVLTIILIPKTCFLHGISLNPRIISSWSYLSFSPHRQPLWRPPIFPFPLPLCPPSQTPPISSNLSILIIFSSFAKSNHFQLAMIYRNLLMVLIPNPLLLLLFPSPIQIPSPLPLSFNLTPLMPFGINKINS